MEEMNPLIVSAMGILTNAGDARILARKALEAVQRQDFQEADQLIKEAQCEIVRAHAQQTQIIQGEARGEHYEYCMLFNHAQDTLMSINSEIELTKTLIKTFQIYSDLITQRSV